MGCDPFCVATNSENKENGRIGFSFFADLPTEAHNGCVPSQMPAAEERRHAVCHFVRLLVGVHLRQLLLRHVELAAINFCNFLKLRDRFTVTVFAN